MNIFTMKTKDETIKISILIPSETSNVERCEVGLQKFSLWDWRDSSALKSTGWHLF